ncbi:MAG: hypothetical protein KatS3mg038_2495 [Candidatus Kapaibacterium sp.]|nr:MAG: hypothetical protein KatS3mg038_2495 [Candidatus Kapabacteria bacterium]
MHENSDRSEETSCSMRAGPKKKRAPSGEEAPFSAIESLRYSFGWNSASSMGTLSWYVLLLVMLNIGDSRRSERGSMIPSMGA